MNRRIWWFVVILVAASFVNLFMRGGVVKCFEGGYGFKGDISPSVLGTVMRDIENGYVDKVDERKLIYGALHGMVSSLNDPNSSFIEPEAYKQIREDTHGHFGGLGVVISMKDGYLTVISALKGSPAEKAGVKAEDRILEISGISTIGIDPVKAVEMLRMGADPEDVRRFLGITLPEAVAKLRGRVGEPVTIKVGKEGEESRDVTITRGKIDIDSVTDVKIVEDGIGYMRLTNFRDEAGDEMNKAINELSEKGMNSLILDLRNNPGGLLESAVEVADRFIPDGEVIVSMRGRDEDKVIELKADDGFPVSQIPMVVLVNEYSASGSEIVAGALQDLGCAIIVGKKTYGKGSVQNLIPLKDGSGLRLTTSRYYSPDGRVIDKIGVSPDIEVDIFPISRGKNGEKKEQEEKKEKVKEEKENYDPQLQQAINILKSLKVFKKMDAKKSEE